MKRIVFSGFGGQGVLTLGHLVANLAMKNGKYVTWMPSYGAEMRGGTANCTVIISDSIIGSPMAHEIDILVAMNQPSIEKFLDQVVPGGYVFSNSSIIERPAVAEGVTVLEKDATNIATELGNVKVANMVMLAGFLKVTDFFTMGDVQALIEEKFGQKSPGIVSLNMQAVETGLKGL